MMQKAQFDTKNKELQEEVIKSKGSMATIMNAIYQYADHETAEMILNDLQ